MGLHALPVLDARHCEGPKARIGAEVTTPTSFFIPTHTNTSYLFTPNLGAGGNLILIQYEKINYLGAYPFIDVFFFM